MHDGASDADSRLESAFERVVLPQLDAGYSLARYLLRNPADAEDAVQEAVLRALRYFHTLRSEQDARAWFLAIVRRECYASRGGFSSRMPTVTLAEASVHELVDGSASPEDSAQRSMLVAHVGAAIDELPERLRETLILREVQQCTYEEIAVITESPVGTVMSRLSRARQKLAAILLGSVDMGDVT